MRRSPTIAAVVVGLVLRLGQVARAGGADSPAGTWVKRLDAGVPSVTLTIEAWGGGGRARLTWRYAGTNVVMTIASTLDGSDAPLRVNGRLSGETMAIKRIDRLHALTVVKMNGEPFGTSRTTFSEDFQTMTVENDFTATAGASKTSRSTENWVRKRPTGPR